MSQQVFVYDPLNWKTLEALLERLCKKFQTQNLVKVTGSLINLLDTETQPSPEHNRAYSYQDFQKVSITVINCLCLHMFQDCQGIAATLLNTPICLLYLVCLQLHTSMNHHSFRKQCLMNKLNHWLHVTLTALYDTELAMGSWYLKGPTLNCLLFLTDPGLEYAQKISFKQHI